MQGWVIYSFSYHNNWCQAAVWNLTKESAWQFEACRVLTVDSPVLMCSSMQSGVLKLAHIVEFKQHGIFAA